MQDQQVRHRQRRAGAQFAQLSKRGIFRIGQCLHRGFQGLKFGLLVLGEGVAALPLGFLEETDGVLSDKFTLIS
jgi:hypothetical protein